MVSRVASYEYWNAPARATMKCIEGAWTDDSNLKVGGSFASPMHNGDWAAADTSSFAVKKATASSDLVIGQLMSEPQGEHVASSRYATVLLLGLFVKEIEIDPAMGSTISVGDTVNFTASGGYFGEGLWNKCTAPSTGSVTNSNGTFALATAGPSCSTGTVIPVLFGYKRFVG
jgi:hypothetical protein